MDTDSRTQGWTQDFLKGRSEYLKKGVWDVASEAIGFALLNTKIIQNARLLTI